MKTRKTGCALTLLLATMALFTPTAQAIFTTELASVSNQVASYVTTLTNAGDRAQSNVVVAALKALSKPSSSVAEDYNLFVAAASKLGPAALEPPFDVIGSNTFSFFLGAAEDQIADTAARIAALNEFVKTKKAASNKLSQATATLNLAATNPNPQLALQQGRQVFSRITSANRLAAIGEEHSGFAPNDLDGKLLRYTGQGSSGTEEFSPSGTFKENGNSAPDGTFTFTRTGLNTGILVLNYDNGAVTRATLTFKTTASGKFTAHTEDAAGEDNDKGTFTIE